MRKLLIITAALAVTVGTMLAISSCERVSAKPNGCTSGGNGMTCCWVQDPNGPPGSLIKVCRRNL